MNKKSKAFLVGLLALSLVGAGTAAAFIATGATYNPEGGKADDAIILNWGSTESLSAVTDLTPTNPAYRTVSVAAPEKSAGVTETPKVKFLVAKGTDGEKTADFNGLSIKIATSEWGAVDPATVAQVGVLTSSSTGEDLYAEIDVTAATTYYLKVEITEEAYNAYAAEAATTELNASVTITYGANIVA